MWNVFFGSLRLSLLNGHNSLLLMCCMVTIGAQSSHVHTQSHCMHITCQQPIVQSLCVCVFVCLCVCLFVCFCTRALCVCVFACLCVCLLCVVVNKCFSGNLRTWRVICVYMCTCVMSVLAFGCCLYLISLHAY